MKVAGAFHPQRVGFALRQCRQQHGRENCDDGDDYEQLNERERSILTLEI
jgi:hypothetical protein